MKKPLNILSKRQGRQKCTLYFPSFEFRGTEIDLIVNSGRNGSGALRAKHAGKVRGPRVQTRHVVLGSCVNADSHLKKIYISEHQYRRQ